MPSAPHPPYDAGFVRAICDVLAQTDQPGLTGSEIDRYLAACRFERREAGLSKREGLFYVLYNAQIPKQSGGPVVGFINTAMAPVNNTRNPTRFSNLQSMLNEVLIFNGLALNEEGKVARAAKRAETLSEGAKLAGRLHSELRVRGAHPLLYQFCDEELITRSLFHGLLEAAKSIPHRVREMTGLAGDGWALYNGAFGGEKNWPLLFINGYTTDSDISEHRGFKNLLIGIHGHYRNPRAHSSRIDSDEKLADFYDAMSLFSYVHRRLDTASKDTGTAY